MEQRTSFGAGRGGLRASEPWRWLPVVPAVVALLVLLAQARSLTHALYLNADTASAAVISSLMGGAPAHSVVTLGNYPWYEPMWLMLASRPLPAHRAMWLGGPFVLTAAAFLIVSWAGWRTFGAWVAAMTLALLVCTSHGMREVLFTPNWHGALVLHSAVLGATLVFVKRHWERMSTGRRLSLGVGVALVTAAGETDRLLIATGVIPFVLAALFGWWQTRAVAQRQIALFATGTAIAGIAAGELAGGAMRSAGVVPSPLHLTLGVTNVAHNLDLLVKGLAYLGGGYVLRGDGDSAALASGALVLTATIVVLAWLCVKSAGHRHGSAGHPHESAGHPHESAGHPHESAGHDSGEAAREAHTTFWGLAITATCAAFLFSSAPTDVLSARYLGVAFVGILALLPVAARSRSWTRGLLAGGASLYAVLAVGHVLSDGVGGYGTGPSQALAGEVERYVAASGATHGYAEYQDAAVLTWETRLHIRVYPVMSCGEGLCPFYLHTISSWYTPAQTGRSFLVTDSSPALIPLRSPPSNLGPPASKASFGPLTVYIYNRWPSLSSAVAYNHLPSLSSTAASASVRPGRACAGAACIRAPASGCACDACRRGSCAPAGRS
jgi:hypothetical protein